MQFKMQTLLNRGGLPCLAQHCSRKYLLSRPSWGGDWCRACSSSRMVEAHATGQVISKEANFVTVRLHSTDGAPTGTLVRTDLLCSVRALLKKIKQTVLVGDNVQVASIDWADKRGVVQEVIERHSEMSDPAIANVDQIILVMSLNLPPFDARQATKFLVSAEAASIPVMLLLNKADLLEDDMTQALVAEVRHWGYKAAAVSVTNGQGMAQLAAALDGRISAVAGPSGVGKSSIINALRVRAQHAQHEQAPQHAQHEQAPQHAQHEQAPQHAQHAQYGPGAQHAQHEQLAEEAQPAQHSPGLSTSNLNKDTAAVSSHLDEAADFHLTADSGDLSTTEHAAPSGTSAPTVDVSSHQGSTAQTAAAPSGSQQHLPRQDQHHSSDLSAEWMQQDRQQCNGPGAAVGRDASSSANNLQDNTANPSSVPSSSPPPPPPSSYVFPSRSAQQELGEQQGDASGPGEVGAGGLGGVAEGVQLQSVGEMSNIGRGMHTTRHVALLEVGQGLLADTPGFNVPSLTNLTVSNLQACFPEIERRLETHRCAFSNCQHLQEPGCCLHEDFDRHPIYVELYHEVKQNEDLERHRSMSKKRRQGNVRFKTKAGGEPSREALLETKTHRRVNRRQTRQGMQDLIDKASQEEGVHL